mgnify:CR=1 FL=1
MNKEDVLRVFNNEIIELPNKSNVSADDFAEVFADAPTKPTYTDLMGIDGGTKGYKNFFDQCKAEGILV